MGLLEWLFGSDAPKRIFISFAMEDSISRDHLVGQARNERSPFEFVDMSVKKPWPEDEWKWRCRTKIKRCHGMIVLLSRHTRRSQGARWEIRCAKEEGVPLVGMHIRKNDKHPVPQELRGERVVTWTWSNIERFIESL